MHLSPEVRPVLKQLRFPLWWVEVKPHLKKPDQFLKSLERTLYILELLALVKQPKPAIKLLLE